MFISNECLIQSLEELASIHPFFGITYLACKLNNLPHGKAEEFSVSNVETEFLSQFYKPVSSSEKFFRVFRPSEKKKFWLNNDYASSGSQATRTQNFKEAFIHPINTNLWGWSTDYIEVLESKLGSKKIPAYSLAFWILKDQKWNVEQTEDDILNKFISTFRISESERSKLFNSELPKNFKRKELFNKVAYKWSTISNKLKIPSPPDLPVEKGGALVSLELKNIDPYKNFYLDLASRCNVITGDNGLGKSFVLECAWWALTGVWTGFPLYPKEGTTKKQPSILFEISSKDDFIDSFVAEYSWKLQDWILNNRKKATIPGLVLYALVDGAFAIWDPARVTFDNKSEGFGLPSTLKFSRQDIWDGLTLNKGNRSRSIFNGLITDWVHWQNANSEAFDILKKVLKRLSPPDLKHGDLGMLEPGEIVRIPGESRPIPTIKHVYGEVPIIFASAAVKRIVAFAYLIVWVWEEHKTSARLMREKPQSKMVVIADEIESHLHPQWQRLIMPALTSISEDLSKELEIQFIITTHSPLVMASIEPMFDIEIDKVFHLDLDFSSQKDIKVSIQSPPFEKRGSADSWLTSSIFELKQPKSIEAEIALEEAKEIMGNPKPLKARIEQISKKLIESLAPHDTFWIRWNYFAEKNGVDI